MTRVQTASGWEEISGPTLTPDEASKEFFDAAGTGRLLLKWCSSCHGWAGPATEFCPHCFAAELVWREASGQGELVTWTVVHSAPHPAFAADMPIVSAIVELTEGPWMNLRVVGPRSDLQVGATVEVEFAHTEEHASYPVVRSSRATGVGE